MKSLHRDVRLMERMRFAEFSTAKLFQLLATLGSVWSRVPLIFFFVFAPVAPVERPPFSKVAKSLLKSSYPINTAAGRPFRVMRNRHPRKLASLSISVSCKRASLAGIRLVLVPTLILV